MTKSSKPSAKKIKATKGDLQFQKMKYVVGKFEQYEVPRDTIVNYLLAYDETSHGYIPSMKMNPLSEQEKKEEQDRLQSSVNVLINTYHWSEDKVAAFLRRYASKEYLGSEIGRKSLEDRSKK